ncbi:NACHT domain-containing protein [Actinocorallia sp. A-T 12471]|uniref:NACHT domain-containing protein n=1 Tax=Actinocorallia sp. A-T 12471 TaxID=3089813 RepID=UPI0029CB5D82|nr:NACHT domain-containing protein [Actinocorallia sp. A-T 12471]MDX6741332.1 NACHT domain-containing protein [Actinocorallia sp. A-T 12471]
MTGRRRDAALAAGLLLLAASVAVVLKVLHDKGLDTAADVGQVVGVVLAAGVPAALLCVWWSRGRRAQAVTSDAVESASDVLARVVADQWRQEAVARQLDDPDPIPVRWRLTGLPVMDHATSVAADGVPVWDGTSDRIGELAERFRGLRRRRLVVLGEPGMGKTTLAVQLVRELLAGRRAGEPVPVLLSAASWDVGAVPDCWQWLAEQLRLNYPVLSAREFGGHGARHVVADRMVLPVLDGLDEVPPDARTAMLGALNRHLGDTGQLIVTCRTDEYAELVAGAGDVLTGAAVIEPDPLTPQVAADYLRHCLPPVPSATWRACLDALEGGSAPALAEVGATPLGLWLVRVTQIRPAADPAHLTDPSVHPSAAHLRAHLFDSLVGALVATRPPTGDASDMFRPRRAHDPGDVLRRLAYLAHHLTHTVQSPTRDLVWWRLAATAMPRARFRAMAAVVMTLVFAGPSLALGALGQPLPVGFVALEGGGESWSVALGLSLAVLVMTWRTSRRWPWDDPGYSALSSEGRSRVGRGVLLGRLTRVVLFGVIGGTGVGLLLAAIALFLDGVGLRVVLVGGTLAGSAAAAGVLLAAMEAPMDDGSAITPRAAWRADRALNVGAVAVSGIAFGVCAMAVTAGDGLVAWDFALGFAGASLGIAIRDEHRVWPAYLIVSFDLWRRRLAPRDLMGFLDDAHRLGLLRAVGPVYQFRHADFQDHLATRWEQGALRAPG